MIREAVGAHARENPDAPAVQTLDHTESYGALDARTDRLARRIAGLGLAPGAVVGVLVRDPPTMWAALLALEHLGLVSFSFYSVPLDPEAMALVRPRVVLTDVDQFAGDPRFASVSAEGEDGPAPPAARARPDDPIRLHVSSGTTGAPKQVLWTRRILEARVRNILERNLPPAARSLSLFRPGTGIGLQTPMATLLQGGAVLAAEQLQWDPAFWSLRPNLISLTPPRLQEAVLSLPHGHRLDPDLRIVTGGSPTPRSVVRETVARISPNLTSWYGASEVGGVAENDAAMMLGMESAVGRVLDGVEVQIVGEDDAPLATGKAGRVRVRTPVMVDGYLGDAVQTGQHFKDGWFYPGDGGVLSADGVLVLSGRTSDVLNFGGTKISPEQVEAIALAVRGVLDAAVFSLPGVRNLPMLCVAVKTGPSYAEAALIKALSDNIALRPIRTFTVRQIPRNSSGKIQRDLLRGLVKAQGGWRAGTRPRPR